MKGSPMTDPIPRRPGTGTRVLLFLAALFGYALALSVAFPPGAPDRLPVLIFSVGLALAAAQRWARGAWIFAFLFPCSGLLARLSGGTDPAAWPVLLFAGFAAGWTFRFIYDFDTRPDPSGPDRAVRALLGLWTIATLLALIEARTLWALFHGLSGRTVNGEGLPESTAIRESLLSFGSLASGASFFLLLRRSGDAIRRRALSAALLGTGVSAAAAILQRLSLLPGESHRFWKATGRLSGGAVDPNSLGMLCALALVVGWALWLGGGRRRSVPALLAAAVLGTGLVLSGSRSGLLVVGASLLALFLFRRSARSARAVALAAGLAAALVAAALLFSGSRGSLGRRVASLLDPSVPAASRVSARPMLWRAAWRLFRQHPVEGGGMGVYTWRLPDLLENESRPWKIRDNPGSAYVQALAETGILGLALTLFFAAALARDALRRLRQRDADPVAVSAAATALAFLGSLAVGSHWLAADTGLFFFLVASLAALPAESGKGWPSPAWVRAALVLYAVSALVSSLSTARAAEAFRYGPRIGFHAAERVAGGEFRWTRRNFAFWMKPRERLRLGLANFSPFPLPLEVTAWDGRRLLHRRALAPGEPVMLRLSGGGSRPAAIRFELSRSFIPRNLGIPGGDARELGAQSVFPDR